MESNIKKIREKTGMSQSQFASYFKIPVKTIQKWEANGSTPPSYIPYMISRILELEGYQNGKSLSIQSISKQKTKRTDT